MASRVVFVEVKARLTGDFGGAAAALTAWKQRRVAEMARDYLARRNLQECPCRFDVGRDRFRRRFRRRTAACDGIP